MIMLGRKHGGLTGRFCILGACFPLFAIYPLNSLDTPFDNK
jgi:hypothetical protein